MAQSSKFKNIKHKGKVRTIKVRPTTDRPPKKPMRLGGDPYIGDRDLNKKSIKELGFSLEAFCEDCYVNKRMSCQEIVEFLGNNYGFKYTRQWVWRILKDRGVIRSQSEAMKVRAITGRMNYTKSTSKINYKGRNTNRSKAWKTRKAHTTPLKKSAVVVLDPFQAKEVRSYAKKRHMTISDALKETFAKNKKGFKTLVIQERKI